MFCSTYILLSGRMFWLDVVASRAELLSKTLFEATVRNVYEEIDVRVLECVGGRSTMVLMFRKCLRGIMLLIFIAFFILTEN